MNTLTDTILIGLRDIIKNRKHIFIKMKHFSFAEDA